MTPIRQGPIPDEQALGLPSSGQQPTYRDEMVDGDSEEERFRPRQPKRDWTGFDDF